MEFLFSKEQMGFDDVESFCIEKGGKIYEPRDENVMKKVLIQAKTEDIGEFWLGIHDKIVEGTFAYASDNTPIKFDNWKEGTVCQIGLK